MLQAGKAELIFSLNKSATDVQRKELDMLRSALAKLSSVAGVLAGFNLSVLFIVPSTAHGSCLEICHVLIGCVSLGCLLLSLVVATCFTLWSPGVALQGPEGCVDVHKAVYQLSKGLHCAFLLFCIGLATHVVVCFFTVLVTSPSVVASLISGTIILLAATRIFSTADYLLRIFLPYQTVSSFLLGNPVRGGAGSTAALYACPLPQPARPWDTFPQQREPHAPGRPMDPKTRSHADYAAAQGVAAKPTGSHNVSRPGNHTAHPSGKPDATATGPAAPPCPSVAAPLHGAVEDFKRTGREPATTGSCASAARRGDPQGSGRNEQTASMLRSGIRPFEVRKPAGLNHDNAVRRQTSGFGDPETPAPLQNKKEGIATFAMPDGRVS